MLLLTRKGQEFSQGEYIVATSHCFMLWNWDKVEWFVHHN